MAFQAVANVAQVEIRGMLQGVPVENTWYAFRASGWTQATLDSLTENVNDVIDENWITQMSPAYVHKEIYARDLSEQNALESYNLGMAGVPGGFSGTPLPNNVTIAISRTSGLTGRSARGRIYYMGLTTGHLATDENYLGSGVASTMTANCNVMDTAIFDMGATSVIVSRYNNGAQRPTPVIFTVTDWSMRDLRLDSQRGRLP